MIKKIAGFAATIAVATGIVVGGVATGVAQAGPIQGDDGYSLDEYRFEYGMDGNVTGDGVRDIGREMNLRQLGWHGNNN